MPRGKNQEKLLSKIAALLEKPVEEIKEARSIYTEEEQVLEAQSVLNFYEWRRTLIRQKGESDRIWEARQRVWKYKICTGCDARFAYSYHYDGVKYCSLDCLKKELRAIGLELSVGRPLNLRWGHRYPGIVPSSALLAIESEHVASSSENDVSEELSLPKSHHNAYASSHLETS